MAGSQSNVHVTIFYKNRTFKRMHHIMRFSQTNCPGLFLTVLLYITLIIVMAVTLPSCSGSKKSATVRQIERQEKKNERKSKSKEVKKAEKAQQKQRQESLKAAEKARLDGITRHRSMQTEEVRGRMDDHLAEANKRHEKKDFFLVRWFKPADDIERIEKKRVKELKKRMAATRKQADRNNEARMATGFKGSERKAQRPSPEDVQHGGGKSMPGGKSKNVNADLGISNTKGTSPRKNPYSEKRKPKAGE